jgi:hypothetical protein
MCHQEEQVIGILIPYLCIDIQYRSVNESETSNAKSRRRSLGDFLSFQLEFIAFSSVGLDAGGSEVQLGPLTRNTQVVAITKQAMCSAATPQFLRETQVPIIIWISQLGLQEIVHQTTLMHVLERGECGDKSSL